METLDMKNSKTVTEFVTIYEDTRSLNSRKKVEYFKQFTHEYLRSFSSCRSCHPGLILELFYTETGGLPHSSHRPAMIDEGGPGANEYSYYLFGTRIHQTAWFVILGYSQEEQLAHVLKWGKHA